MSVRVAIEAELDALGAAGWQREAAVALADKVDSDGQAAAVRELRVLMAALGSGKAVVGERETRGDEIRAQREKRRAEAIRAAVSES